VVTRRAMGVAESALPRSRDRHNWRVCLGQSPKAVLSPFTPNRQHDQRERSPQAGAAPTFLSKEQ